jgi:hypothetical protein
LRAGEARGASPLETYFAWHAGIAGPLYPGQYVGYNRYVIPPVLHGPSVVAVFGGLVGQRDPVPPECGKRALKWLLGWPEEGIWPGLLAAGAPCAGRACGCGASARVRSRRLRAGLVAVPARGAASQGPGGRALAPFPRAKGPKARMVRAILAGDARDTVPPFFEQPPKRHACLLQVIEGRIRSFCKPCPAAASPRASEPS